MQRRAPSSSKSGVPTTGGSVRGNVVAGLSWVKVRRKANIFGGFIIVLGGLDWWLLGGNAGSLIMLV